MSEQKLNIALFSPSHNPYSETFIQAHKKYLSGNVFYYYGSGASIQLEHHVDASSGYKGFKLKIFARLTKKPSNYVWEQRLLHSLKTHKIDVVLVEYGTHAYELRKVLKASGLPVVVHFHGYDASMYKTVARCNKYSEVFEYSNYIVAVSKKMESMLLELGCPREKLIYNVYGPQPEFLDVTPNFSKKQFIGIGRFTDKKAPYYTILAFKKALEKHEDAQLLLAGNGPLLNSCENLIKHLKLEKNVQLIGVITPEQYRMHLNETRAFVQHSLRASSGDMEGTPLAVLEASSAGLPVISTYHAGIPDVIVHGKTGLLSEEHDVATMAVNMLELLDDLEFAKRLGSAGRKNIRENFSLKIHIDKLEKCLEQAVGVYNKKY